MFQTEDELHTSLAHRFNRLEQRLNRLGTDYNG
jgi:hypothetical protein